MSSIRNELVNAAITKANGLAVHDGLDKRYEFTKKTLLDDKSLTNDEKSEAVKILTKSYDKNKIIYNEGKKRICENCQLQCLATSYCEICVRNYLKKNFPNWTSGNDDIDNLIQKCQIESLSPDKIIEWIPYKNLQNITQEENSKFYEAHWIDGCYYSWDSKERQLKRFGEQKVVLKKLGNVEEAFAHITISNKWEETVKCYGLTQNPSNGDYMLVMDKMDLDLRKYLQQNNPSWKERIKIVSQMICAIYRIHTEHAIHRNLNSQKVLYSQHSNNWYIGGLRLCGPVDKPLGNMCGELPYIAPEVISGKELTFASDIYSIGILMWEISSGQPPFANLNHDYDLANKIVNGMRPELVPGIPSEYTSLIERCWSSNPLERPNISTLYNEIDKIQKSDSPQISLPESQNTADGKVSFF